MCTNNLVSPLIFPLNLQCTLPLKPFSMHTNVVSPLYLITGKAPKWSSCLCASCLPQIGRRRPYMRALSKHKSNTKMMTLRVGEEEARKGRVRTPYMCPSHSKGETRIRCQCRWGRGRLNKRTTCPIRISSNNPHFNNLHIRALPQRRRVAISMFDATWGEGVSRDREGVGGIRNRWRKTEMP